MAGANLRRIQTSRSDKACSVDPGDPFIAPVVLSSERCQHFINTLSESFDWIIIDSPPVMAVTDASQTAHLAAGVLFVVAADQTKGPAAANALTQLDSANARFVGTGPSGVNFKRNGVSPGAWASRTRTDQL